MHVFNKVSAPAGRASSQFTWSFVEIFPFCLITLCFFPRLTQLQHAHRRVIIARQPAMRNYSTPIHMHATTIPLQPSATTIASTPAGYCANVCSLGVTQLHGNYIYVFSRERKYNKEGGETKGGKISERNKKSYYVPSMVRSIHKITKANWKAHPTRYYCNRPTLGPQAPIKLHPLTATWEDDKDNKHIWTHVCILESCIMKSHVSSHYHHPSYLCICWISTCGYRVEDERHRPCICPPVPFLSDV